MAKKKSFTKKKVDSKTPKRRRFVIIAVSIIILIILILVLSSKNADVEDVSENDSEPYESSDTGIIKQIDKYEMTFNYPSTWSEDEASYSNVLFQLLSPDNISSITIKEHSFSTIDQEEFMSQNSQESLQENFEANELLNEVVVDIVELGGVEIYRFNYLETVSEDMVFHVESYYIIRTGRMLSINYVAYPDDFDTYLDDARGIINSISFN